MFRNFCFVVYQWLGRWLFGFIPLPDALEKQVITQSLAYLDTLLLTQQPDAWERADRFILDQIEAIGLQPFRHTYLKEVVRQQFDPEVFVSRYTATQQTP